MDYKSEKATKSTGKMPVLFIGHGSPMNAIEENETVEIFNEKPVMGHLCHNP